MYSEVRFIFKEFITWLVLGLPVGLPITAATGQERDLPLKFEANRGQFAPQVLFLARTAGHFIYLTREGMTLSVNASSRRGAALEMKFVGANPAAAITSEGILPGISNYFIGNGASGGALASGLAGVYQVAIQIPASLSNGDYPVVATIDGQASPVTTLITVQQ
jgi:hypothetical protein